MRLPNADRALVDIRKLVDYSLNKQHEVGKHKARVFEAALGLTTDDAMWLRERLLAAALEGGGVRGKGLRFWQDIHNGYYNQVPYAYGKSKKQLDSRKREGLSQADKLLRNLKEAELCRN
jgi:uncharacterized protein DUF6883